MALKLFSKIECPFCWKVKIALKYLDMDYELVEWKKPDRDTLLKLSPNGLTPVLQDNELIIWDSVPIIYYLEDLAGRKTLFPGEITDRSKARLLHTYSNSIVGINLREIIFEKRNKIEAKWDLEKISRHQLGWGKSLDWLEAQIEDEHNFLSAGFSVADAALLPRLGLAEYYGVGVRDTHRRLHNWFQNGRQTPVYFETSPR